MPYARLVQAAREAREASDRQRRDEWKRTAWLAWTEHLARPAKKHKTFAQWLNMFGLGDPRPASMTSESEKAGGTRRANDNAMNALQAFRRPSGGSGTLGGGVGVAGAGGNLNPPPNVKSGPA